MVVLFVWLCDAYSNVSHNFAWIVVITFTFRRLLLLLLFIKKSYFSINMIIVNKYEAQR